MLYFLKCPQKETHQELADRTGLNVVEYRRERGMLPVVVATPSEKSKGEMFKFQAKKDDYDLRKIFDPYKGLHRPKTRAQLFWCGPDTRRMCLVLGSIARLFPFRSRTIKAFSSQFRVYFNKFYFSRGSVSIDSFGSSEEPRWPSCSPSHASSVTNWINWVMQQLCFGR